jgi:putative ATPase
MPEGALALAQAVVYLALAPKSNALYVAYGEVQRDIAEHPSYGVPLHIRNAPTPLMEALGFGERYLYPHSFPDALVGQSYLPRELESRRYYRPAGRGAERELGATLDRIRRVREELRKREGGGSSPEGSDAPA